MAERKNRGGGDRHPFAKKGIEPGTPQYIKATEEAAEVLATEESKRTEELKQKLSEIWNRIFYGDALIRLCRFHGLQTDDKKNITKKDVAVAALVQDWTMFPDEATWDTVAISEAEMPDPSPAAAAGGGGRGSEPSPRRSASRSRSRARDPEILNGTEDTHVALDHHHEVEHHATEGSETRKISIMECGKRKIEIKIPEEEKPKI